MARRGVGPGSIVKAPAGNVTEFPNVSLPVNSFRISAPAALKVLCPELHSGNGGAGKVLGWYGVQFLPSMVIGPLNGPPHARICLPWKRNGTAVTGRTESRPCLASQ